jgi:hypothetical protein
MGEHKDRFKHGTLKRCAEVVAPYR